ncbi:hypothetical protein cyc_04133 [Cyclospora cayetanensis]|uniref:Uncharacterized protein n=1 Tax=Cyclospora cayetanensis TaxID=88456 RepID=A0A1D3D256_9EIME|nr:hypothetical protein cyc_04133 [Cyclospora cayetanensis]
METSHYWANFGAASLYQSILSAPGENSAPLEPPDFEPDGETATDATEPDVPQEDEYSQISSNLFDFISQDDNTVIQGPSSDESWFAENPSSLLAHPIETGAVSDDDEDENIPRVAPLIGRSTLPQNTYQPSLEEAKPSHDAAPHGPGQPQDAAKESSAEPHPSTEPNIEEAMQKEVSPEAPKELPVVNPMNETPQQDLEKGPGTSHLAEQGRG